MESFLPVQDYYPDEVFYRTGPVCQSQVQHNTIIDSIPELMLLFDGGQEIMWKNVIQ